MAWVGACEAPAARAHLGRRSCQRLHDGMLGRQPWCARLKRPSPIGIGARSTSAKVKLKVTSRIGDKKAPQQRD